MKQTLNIMKWQLAINLRYCYSARRDTQNMSASRIFPTLLYKFTKFYYTMILLLSYPPWNLI